MIRAKLINLHEIGRFLISFSGLFSFKNDAQIYILCIRSTHDRLGRERI